MSNETSHTAKQNDQQRIQNSRLYALFWRWHFLTGFFAVPLLVLISLTGAIAVFRPELYPLVYPDLYDVQPRREKISVDDQISAVRAAYPNHEIQSILIYPAASESPTRIELVRYENGKIVTDFFNPFGQSKVFVDPYTGRVLGKLDEGRDLFATLINLHISLFAPPWGRLAVDLVTSWGIISLLAGLYLWWPRRKEKIWGVWLPRFRNGKWIVLRDLHTVLGLYFTPLALITMFSGLLVGYSAYVTGAPFYLAGQYPAELLINPPKAAMSCGADRLPIETLIARFGPLPGDGTLSIHFPHEHTGVYTMVYGSRTDALNYRMALIDPYTGEFYFDQTPRQMALGTKIFSFFGEELHLGTILGLPTKILALLSCIMIIVMSVTSWLMWWHRRPAGTWGIPKAVEGINVPEWVTVTFIILTIWLMPMAGATLILWGLVTGIINVLSRLRHTRVSSV